MFILRMSWDFLVHPRRTSQRVRELRSIGPCLILVSAFAGVLGLAYLISYLNHNYPPPPVEWEIWVKTWGKEWMEPFIPIPNAYYRLFLAGAILPGAFLAWTGMAAAGRLFSWLFHGKAAYLQYLNLVGLSIFPFWTIAAVIDFLYMGLVGPQIVPALAMAYGPLVRELVYAAPTVIYVVPLAAGGVYGAIFTQAVEGFAAWKATVIGRSPLPWR
jgi:hypothetical protein